MNSLKIIALAAIIAAFAAGTYRVEWRSRLHTATLRQEWTITTKVFGVAVMRRQGSVVDQFPGCYAAIIDQQPDSKGWMQQPVDYYETLSGGMHRCGGGPAWLHYRIPLLDRVYQRFRDGDMLKAEAAEYLRRINELGPPKTVADARIQYAKLDELGKELGFR